MKPRDEKQGAQTLWRGILTLVLGSASAKVITFGSTLALARLFDPADFAVLAVFSSWLVIASPLLTLKFSQGIPLARTEKLAKRLLQGSIAIALAVSLIVGAVVAILAHVQMLPPWMSRSWVPYAVGPALAMQACLEILSAWFLRTRNYKGVARLSFGQAIVGAVSKIGFGLAGAAAGGLVLGQLLQQASAAIVALRRLRPILRGFVFRPTLVWVAMKRMRDQPLFRLPAQLILALTTQAVIIYFASEHTIAETGQLSMALAVVGVPVSLLAQTSGQAFYAEASKLGRRNAQSILRIARSVVVRLGLLGLFPVVVLFAAGPRLFELLLGRDWVVAGTYAASLAPGLFFQFLSAPLAGVYGVLGRQSLLLRTNIVRFLLVATVLALGWYVDADAVHLLTAYSCVVACHYLIFTASTFQMISKFANEHV